MCHLGAPAAILAGFAVCLLPPGCPLTTLGRAVLDRRRLGLLYAQPLLLGYAWWLETGEEIQRRGTNGFGFDPLSRVYQSQAIRLHESGRR